MNPLELPIVSLFEKSLLPEIAAVYAVIEDELILYVGSTVKLRQRCVNHQKYQQIILNHPNAKIHYHFVSNLKELRDIETEFINNLLPQARPLFFLGRAINLKNVL